MDPPRRLPSHRIVDDIDDEDDVLSADYSRSSFDSGDVTSVLRGHVNFVDDAFVTSYSRTRLLSRRRRIVLGAIFISLVLVIVVSYIASFRSHHDETSEGQHYPPGGDEISNATSSDASMPANVPNVTNDREMKFHSVLRIWGSIRIRQ
jgi:hypothetical protein